VLFPLILRLLKPEVFSTDRDGMSETRVQVASLLCKVFLQYLVLLSKWDGMLDLWLRIIEIMDRLMNSGQGDSLVREAAVCLTDLVGLMLTFVCLMFVGGGCSRKLEEYPAVHVE
jgi:brefeldin A-resistance guanine nucleotide exchange factor 1